MLVQSVARETEPAWFTACSAVSNMHGWEMVDGNLFAPHIISSEFWFIRMYILSHKIIRQSVQKITTEGVIDKTPPEKVSSLPVI
jgi:hypothetical protein